MLICVYMVLGMVPGKISVAASAETEETVVVDDQNQMKPDIVEFREIYDNGVIVRVRFVDLFDIQNSLDELKLELELA